MENKTEKIPAWQELLFVAILLGTAYCIGYAVVKFYDVILKSYYIFAQHIFKVASWLVENVFIYIFIGGFIILVIGFILLSIFGIKTDTKRTENKKAE